MESPVWTPMGSKFSMEQMMTQLSALVAHHFHFVFLPAEQRFFDQNFGDGRKFDAALGDFFELVAIVSDAAAGAAEREGRANDEREAANLFRDRARFVHVVRRAADRHIEADASASDL